MHIGITHKSTTLLPVQQVQPLILQLLAAQRLPPVVVFSLSTYAAQMAALRISLPNPSFLLCGKLDFFFLMCFAWFTEGKHILTSFYKIASIFYLAKHLQSTPILHLKAWWNSCVAMLQFLF